MKRIAWLVLILLGVAVGFPHAEEPLQLSPAEDASSDDSAEDSAQPHPTRQPPPFAAGARRGGGGYQQVAPERLTCDDYSLSYFRRHPVVATVCGVDISENSVETISATAPGVQISATIHKSVSTSPQPLPKAPAAR